jgi:hypothetical protein
MPINNGVLSWEVSTDDSGGFVRVEVYYDATQGVRPDGTVDRALQPIVNTGSPGRALRATNSSGSRGRLTLIAPDSTVTLIAVPPGGLDRTANQLASLGVTNAAQASGFSLANHE